MSSQLASLIIRSLLRSPFLRSSFISLSFLRIVMRNDCNNYKNQLLGSNWRNGGAKHYLSLLSRHMLTA
ncbi:MAG: hypothetical protein ACTS6G_04845 [Candidatus Hodgkinia cicadicola]